MDCCMGSTAFSSFKAFLVATRPRTYPLAISGIIVGNALAFSRIGNFTAHNWVVFALSVWVALGLQILSNLANDYGDAVKGTDAHRLDRQISQNLFNQHTFKKLIIGWALLIFCSGVGLVIYSFTQLFNIVLFIGLGIVAIFSAILYTMGKKPYGYHAKGELAVFIFFGLVNVLGSLYLQSQYIRVSDIIMATSVGLLCTCVLMINNMRDIDSDQLAQKNTLAVQLGKETISQLYRFMLLSAYFLIVTFGVLRQNFYLPSVLLMAFPVFRHLKSIDQYANETLSPPQLAPQLKTMVIITLITCLIIRISIFLFNRDKLI